jgi:hypothetical protein
MSLSMVSVDSSPAGLGAGLGMTVAAHEKNRQLMR